MLEKKSRCELAANWHQRGIPATRISQYLASLKISPLGYGRATRRKDASFEHTSDELERLGLAIVVGHICGFGGE